MFKTKIIFTLIFSTGFFFLLKTDCLAATLYVSPSGSGSACTSGSPCALSYANSNAMAGDIVTLAGGTYSTSINPTRSGSSAAKIVYTVASGATATITAQRGIDLRNGQDHITVQKGGGSALRFSANSYCVLEAQDADNLILDGITTINVNPTQTGRGVQLYDSDYVTIKNSHLTNDYMGDRYSDYVYLRNCKHLDIGPNNYIGNGTHTALKLENTCQYIRIHDNHFDNEWRRGLELRYSSGFQTDALIEGNFFDRNGRNSDTNPYSAEDCRGRSSSAAQINGQRLVIRNNTSYKDDMSIVFTDPDSNLQDIWFYHNAIYKPQIYASVRVAAESGSGMLVRTDRVVDRISVLNNIIAEVQDGYILTWSTYDGGSFVNNRFLNNIFYDLNNFRIRYDNSTYSSVSAVESARSSIFAGNIQANPLFVNPENGNLALNNGSPAINAARFLATVSSKSGNTLTLGANEAYAFAPSDWNIPNFFGDNIYSQNKATARVVSRRAHNIIEVSNGSAFAAGDRLTVVNFSGSAPDIGAFEYGGTTPAPTPTPNCQNCCSSTQTCPTAFTTVGTCARCCATACQTAPVGTACHKSTASAAITANFGSPYDLAVNPANLLINTLCQSAGVRVNVGSGNQNQYIWHQGNIWRNNAWQAVNLSGPASPYGANWFQGSASASITLPSTELSQENIFIAYVCTWSSADSRWKCGCRDSFCAQRYWQMQKFGNY